MSRAASSLTAEVEGCNSKNSDTSSSICSRIRSASAFEMSPWCSRRRTATLQISCLRLRARRQTGLSAPSLCRPPVPAPPVRPVVVDHAMAGKRINYRGTPNMINLNKVPGIIYIRQRFTTAVRKRIGRVWKEGRIRKRAAPAASIRNVRRRLQCALRAAAGASQPVDLRAQPAPSGRPRLPPDPMSPR